MITAKLKPRPVITLIINDSVGNIELPEFAEDNYCYLSLEKDGTLTLHEDPEFVLETYDEDGNLFLKIEDEHCDNHWCFFKKIEHV